MILEQIAPDEIIVNDAIGYRDYASKKNQDEIADLVMSISATGLRTPLGGYRDANGKFVLVSGFRRLRAIKAIRAKDAKKFATVPAIVEAAPASDKEALLNSITSNEQSQPTPLEFGGVIIRLANEFGMTQAQIGKELGKSQPTISRNIWLTELPAEIQDAIRADVISPRAAFAYMGDKEAPAKLAALIKGEVLAPATKGRTKAADPAAPTGEREKTSWQDIVDELLWVNQDFMVSVLPENEGAKDYTQMEAPQLKAAITGMVVAIKKLHKKHKFAIYPEIEEIEEK